MLDPMSICATQPHIHLQKDSDTMRKFIMAVFSMALIALSFVFIAPAANAGTDKIDICHATGNGKYVPIEISKDGTANGHAGSDHQNGNDIIPAFSWIDNKVKYYFDGQNLDKAALLASGCKAPAETVNAAPVPPKYIPATCLNPSLPYGQVIVPIELGEGIAGSTKPELNTANTVWTTSYALADSTEDRVYTWPAGVDGTYKFDVVPLTEDPFWVVDSKTGVGSCILPDTGASNYLLPLICFAALLLGLGVAANRISRRKA